MKATFESEDTMEIKRIVMSENMALFIWDLVHNGWRDFKPTDYDYYPAWEKIRELLDKYEINIDELIE